MSTQLSLTVSILIAAPVTRVWEALTTPELIKQYFYGTQAESDWKEGSPLYFRGVYEGKEYLDKGIIKKSTPPHLFQYTYISSMSNLEDKPENYATITYELKEENGMTHLTVTQDNMHSQEAKEHSEQGWQYVLGELKKLVEKK